MQIFQSSVKIFMQRFAHLSERAFHAPRFRMCIQLVPSDPHDRFDIQDTSDRRHCRCDTSAFFQIFQRIHCDIDRRVERLLFQTLFDLASCHPLLCHLTCVKYGLHLRYGNPFIVHNMHPSVIFFRQHHSAVAGCTQSACHRYIDNLIMFFQKGFPHIHHISRRRKRRGDLRPCCLPFVKFFRRNIYTLIISRTIYDHRHRDNGNPELFSFIR